MLCGTRQKLPLPIVQQVAKPLVNQDEFPKESPFIAIISDGSTDTASKEAEIVFVRAAAKREIKRVLDTYCLYILLN
ncbi:hypothetical protein DPMN_187253 [Dreissena polymorpha]|uniref:Uncharacterized protein n=1 Tax=Dreissena polymorpha TaxID=45954 RepID=A0A9D4DR73_DREPO|nr:hypothetical protein DPMN_187253 [Dreissena polymorpha]